MTITGKTLIDWGFDPERKGKWFGTAIEDANAMRRIGLSDETIISRLRESMPVPPPVQEYRTNSIPFEVFLDAETPEEQDNLRGVVSAMDQLMRVPTVKKGVVMPDACPAGIIPVGGVVATEDAIHPGFHSADICCSMAITVFKRDEKISHVLDVAEKVTHFGPLKISPSNFRHKVNKHSELRAIIESFEGNPFLRGLGDVAASHFMTQGDGNHFLYVGHLKSTGQLAMVTHHGSRGLGAFVYKRGMQAAEKHTGIVSPRTPKQAAWIKASSDTGEQYWEALQIVRNWTKANHYAIHDEVARKLGNKVVDCYWNEHNFVFRKDDGLYYHGKGATPNWEGFSPDDTGRTLIPLNMAEPILISEHEDNHSSFGFAPHGAGRNMSRTKFLESNRPEIPKGIDVRFYCGVADHSELPEAYKNAQSVKDQILKYRLGKVVDEVLPGGSLMAGDWEKNAPWKKGKRKGEREAGPLDARARELCIAAGVDPESRVGEGRGQPAWCTFRDAAKKEMDGE